MRSTFRSMMVPTALMLLMFTFSARAQNACAADDYDCKIADQTKLIEADPKNAEAYYNRAVAYTHKEDFAHAKADLDIYLSLPNDKPEYKSDGYAERGWARYKSKDLAGALADYDKAIATYEKNGSAYFRKGVVYADQGKWQLALDQYDIAFKYDPQETEVYYNRARAYRMLGNYKKALDQYTTYLDLNSAKRAYVADGYRGRGITYNLLGNYSLAVADLTKAIELDPSIADSFVQRATAYRKLGKLQLAAADEQTAKGLK